MRCVAVVEIPSVGKSNPSSSESAGLSSRLLKAAYEASRRGVVVLLLPEGANRVVDRELDRYVAANRRVHGVVYREVSDPTPWRGVDRDALFVVSSPRSRAAADAIGARCVDADVGLLALQNLSLDLAGATGRTFASATPL
jgi:hypothetical protein